MEDYHAIHVGPMALKQQEPVLFGVFDGHGGQDCARYLAQNLCTLIAEHHEFASDPVRALTDGFEEVDRQYIELARQLQLGDGSTATVLLLELDGKTNVLRYHLACAGDSRAILIRTDGTGSALVEDHSPAREDERARIKAAGGRVLLDEDHDIYRVASADGAGLAVTRAIGDADFKPIVTATPEVASATMTANDAYICLASDGLWGDLSNDEVASQVMQRGAAGAAAYVIDEAFARGSEDNITVIVVDLKEAQRLLLADRDRRRSRKAETEPDGLLSHARALSARLSVASAAAASPKHEVEDVRVPFAIPGVHVFSNDLVLWRDPLGSLLWFALGNMFGFATVVMDYPVVPQVCLALLCRLLLVFGTFRLARALNKLGLLRTTEEDVNKFVARYQVVSAVTITNFTTATVATLLKIVEWWSDIVVLGSTTQMLFALRTVTYLYTPVSIAAIAWAIFIVVFSVPAVYSRYKAEIDAQAEVVRNRVGLWQLKVEQRVKPHLIVVRERIAGIKHSLGVPVSSPVPSRSHLRKSATTLVRVDGDKRRSQQARSSARMAGQLSEEL